MKNLIQIPIKLYNQLTQKAALAGNNPEEYLQALLAQEALRIRLEKQWQQEQKELGLDLEDKWLVEE